MKTWDMETQILFENVSVKINEVNKLIIVQPQGEYFYSSGQEDCIFHDAKLIMTALGNYIIEGIMIREERIDEMGFDFQRMKDSVPEEFIKKHSFLWLHWYSASGTVRKKTRTRYFCNHDDYRIAEHFEIIEQQYQVP